MNNNIVSIVTHTESQKHDQYATYERFIFLNNASFCK